jgi:hypothetical protein
VRFELGVWGEDGKRVPHLGFLLRKETPKSPALLLVGSQLHTLDHGGKPPVCVEPDKKLADPFMSDGFLSTFGINSALAIAIQCHARGWDHLAGELLWISFQQEAGHQRSQFYQPAGLSAKDALPLLAWAHWANELIRPDTDRAAIRKRLKALLAAEPISSSPSKRSLVHALDLALEPSRAESGSTEALIDGLMELSGTGHYLSEPPYCRLADLGFGAVPALIKHLRDQRLTRHAFPGVNNAPPRHHTVGDVVSSLLEALAGHELTPQRDPRAALVWWQTAGKVGERNHFRAHVLPVGATRQWPNEHMLRLIAKKYPEDLPRIYATLLDIRPQIHSWPIVKAMSESHLSVETKRQALLRGAVHKDFEHRRAALGQLIDVAPEQFVPLLIQALQELPKTITGSYWLSSESLCARLVLHTNDPRAWETLARVATEWDVGLRMEIIGAMRRGSRNRKQRLAFLAGFLTDSELRDAAADPRRFGGYEAGHEFVRLEVRNLAAMQIGAILKVAVQPTPTWTADDWLRFRGQVSDALRVEPVPGK